MPLILSHLSKFKGIGILILVATFLSSLTFTMFWLEYGVFNFGDSDLPPYQPDTPFEKACDALFFASLFSAVIVWAYIAVLVFIAIYRAFMRHLNRQLLL